MESPNGELGMEYMGSGSEEVGAGIGRCMAWFGRDRETLAWPSTQRRVIFSIQTHGIAPCTVYLAHHTPNHETHRLAHTKVRRRQLQKTCPHFMSMPNSLGSLSPLFSATPTMSRRSLVIDYKNEPRRAPQVTQG